MVNKVLSAFHHSRTRCRTGNAGICRVFHPRLLSYHNGAPGSFAVRSRKGLARSPLASIRSMEPICCNATNRPVKIMVGHFNEDSVEKINVVPRLTHIAYSFSNTMTFIALYAPGKRLLA